MVNAQMTFEEFEAGLFWSRFGGWKHGRADRDDDVAEGFATPEDAYYIYCLDCELSEAYS